jgi:hypothetical protein
MRDARLFEARCKHCGRHILTAPLFTDPEIDTIRDHLMPCARGERISEASSLGRVLAHLHVTAVAE